MIKEVLKKAAKRLFWATEKLGLLDRADDETYVRLRFYLTYWKRLNLANPQSYNEKLQWLKLYDHNPVYPALVDKYTVKQYVAEKIGSEYIIPTIGVWDSFNEINFDSLPDRFVLKCTHDSGSVVLCDAKSSFDYVSARKKIEHSLKRNYYYSCREWPYKNIHPRIIAEEYLGKGQHGLLEDYKLMCFGGKFDNTMVCVGRNTEEGVKYYHFDRDWNYLPYVEHEVIDRAELQSLKPKNYKKMIELAEILSAGFPEVRVDFYNIDGTVYFGELTFYQSGGFDTDFTEEASLLLGRKIKLPERYGS